MEVVAATPLPKMGGTDSPFRDHDVREWSRLDMVSGAMERATLETDSWTANTNDVCHKYGKVLDTRARTGLDGSLAAASRQFEVFQSRSTTGTTRVQVVKTQTVSSSRWSSKGQEKFSANSMNNVLNGFENLKLAVNPLDLTSQKSKASVGRSVSRRPPTRQRPRETSSPPKIDIGDPFRQHFTAAQNLNRVSRLCHQIHETAVRHAFGATSTPSISERESGDGSASGVEIVEIESTTNSSSDKEKDNESTVKTNLTRTKSTSSETLNQIVEKDCQSDFEDLETWRRESKVRRSLQFPKQNKTCSKTKPPDLPENSVSVRKIREELEKGKRLSTALRNSSLDLVTLDQIIQSVSSNSSLDKNSSTDENLDEALDSDGNLKKPKHKRDSFVTVESIKEVKDRLRRTSSPTNADINSKTKREDIDDGIDDINVKDETFPKQSRVKSYVFGMENLLQQNQKPFVGTGSLELKSKLINGTTNHKNEDWYNRRKSYGFEKVHSHEESSESSLKSKKPVESSTDSGICRSNEMVPSANRKSDSSDVEKSDDNKHFSSDNIKTNGISYGNVRKMTGIFSQKKEDAYSNGQLDDLTNSWTKKFTSDGKSNDAKSTTLSSLTVTLETKNDNDKEIKRNSISGDGVNHGSEFNEIRIRKTSPYNNTDQLTKAEAADENNRKTKKVEFCKTEIHFAAETGRVNIVETDEKPPPSQNFRRRRRNSGSILNYNQFASKNGLPVMHFGDNSLDKKESFEKMMFGISDEESDSRLSPEPPEYEKIEPRVPPIYGSTKNTQKNISDRGFTQDLHTTVKQIDSDNFYADSNTAECDHLKGILKNKPIKPKPYHLGEIPLSSDSDGETHPWNIKPPIRLFEDVHRSILNQNSEFEDVRPKFQTTLKIVRPTKFPDNLGSDNPVHLRTTPLKKDNRPNSWSIMDSKPDYIEPRSIHTNDEENEWVSAREIEKDPKSIMNKGLVVRIGNETMISKHTFCSNVSTDLPEKDTNKMSTTKITVDVSPCSTNEYKPRLTYTKYQRSHDNSFKSTPLVLDTIRHRSQNDDKQTRSISMNQAVNTSNYTKQNICQFKNLSYYKQRNFSKNNVSEQLENLKKLYENIQSDSDADQEVQELMSKSDINPIVSNNTNADNSSISNSWKRVSKVKSLESSHSLPTGKKTNSISSSWKRYHDPKRCDEAQSSFVKATSRFGLNSSAKKEYPSPRRSLSPSKIKFSPPPQRKTSLPSYHPTFYKDELSSPSLVTKSSVTNYAVVNKTNKKVRDGSLGIEKSINENRIHKYENVLLKQPTDAQILNNNKSQEILETDYENVFFGESNEPKIPHYKKNTKDSSLNKHNVVLRRPKDSEMTYFGVKAKQKLTKTTRDDKPDLLKHCNKRIASPRRNIKPENQIYEDHIYENINFKGHPLKKEFDSSILDELTQAADQILQAVNGYTDDDLTRSRLSSDDEYKQPLDTISETKSWKNSNFALHARKPTLASAAKVRVKRTSSTSSVDSLNRDRKGSFGGLNEKQRKDDFARSIQKEVVRKKAFSDSSSTKTSTKVTRRIQRACSREALLQSHGSSSEDLPIQIEPPIRKPRALKKPKVSQLGASNEIDHKKNDKERSAMKPKVLDQKIINPTAEVRNKTTVSSIRNTAEKSARDRSRARSEDRSSKYSAKRETSRGTVTNSSRSTSKQSYQPSSRLMENDVNSNVTQHRISTANIKKCKRAEATKK